jgi:hypothetical protein
MALNVRVLTAAAATGTEPLGSVAHGGPAGRPVGPDELGARRGSERPRVPRGWGSRPCGSALGSTAFIGQTWPDEPTRHAPGAHATVTRPPAGG